MTCGRPIHGGSNSGRKVTISSTPMVRNPVHRPTERFQARGVDPMHILENHQHRIGARQRLDLQIERFQCSLPPLLRVSSSAG